MRRGREPPPHAGHLQWIVGAAAARHGWPLRVIDAAAFPYHPEVFQRAAGSGAVGWGA